MSKHHKCKWSRVTRIECYDGRIRLFRWQECREEDVNTLIRRLRAPPGGNEAEVEGEVEEEDDFEPAEQPQEPQEDAAGPSSYHAPAAGAAQPVAQQEAGPSRGKTVPGPFGLPVPAPGVPPPPPKQKMPFAPGMMPGSEDMSYAMGSQYMGGYSSAQGMGYPQDATFVGRYGGGGDSNYAGEYGGYQDMPPGGGHKGRYEMPFTRTPGDMPFPEDVEDLLYLHDIRGMPLPGNLGDMPLPGGPGEGEEMPLPEGYDQSEGMPMAGTHAGGGGGTRAPSTVAAAAEAKPGRVAVSPENLYHSEETDGVVKSQPYTALESVWGPVKYSKY